MTTAIPPGSIRVAEDRQRGELDLGSLKRSIQARGVITPIIVTEESPPRLIAGERRLRCALELGLEEIPVRFLSELDPIELEIIELEENIKRKNLTWQEEVRATERIHKLYVTTSVLWTQVKTADSIGIDNTYVSKQLRVARDLEDPNVAKSGSTNEAYNLLMRRDERARAAALDDLLGEEKAPARTPMEEYLERKDNIINESGEIPKEVWDRIETASKAFSPSKIIQGDFCQWWRTWTGPKFNLIHCDFPYGIGVFNANGVRTGENRSQMGRDEGEDYNDDPEVYKKLVEELLEAIPHIASRSCHLMFWFSNKWEIEQWTRKRFAEALPGLTFSHYPLIWLKSDNSGIASVPSMWPRHIYEEALFGSLGERPIVKLKSDAYAAPTDKSLHTSCKPEPMLRHFMEMLVDEHTVMLDPTCGSGSSVRAAESLGAKFCLGLELDGKMAEMAERKRSQEELKRNVERGVR